MNKRILVGVCLALATKGFAQDSSKTGPIAISGYAEAYYQYDVNNPINNTRPAFTYSHNRNNEFALNLAFIKAGYATEKLRANIALAAGTYVNANYSSEPSVLKNIYEANVGLKLSKNSNLWLDAGIFSSHIGFESAIGKDCRTLTRSLLAENSPYYESGVKIGYTSKNERWFLSALVLNGWQRIQRIDGNSTPAFGTQVTYKPSSKVTLNSSTFIGNDKSDSVRQMRYFHNFYGIFRLSKTVEATVGFDAGMEQQAKGSSSMNSWYSPVAIVRFATSNKTAIALRAEYYNDEHGVIISTGTANGFKTWGFSANFDYAIANNVLWRFEAKTLDSKDNVFEKRTGTFVKNATSIATSLSIAF